MGFCGKTAGCSNSRRICHCLNRLQKECRKNGSKLERMQQTASSCSLASHFQPRNFKFLQPRRPRKRELVACTLTLCFYYKSEDILCMKQLYIWIVQAREVPDNFHCIEFKIEIDQVLICKCLIKNSRDEIDKHRHARCARVIFL